MILVQLFVSFLQIGCLSFGGGYAAMPLIEQQVVLCHNWITAETFTDLVTISEMTPGPIAVNAATFVGTQMAGIPGAVCATLGCVLPSCLFVTGLAFLYKQYRKLTVMQGILNGLRPAVVAMIAKAGVTILCAVFLKNGSISLRAVFYFIGAVIALRKLKWNPILVMLSCGIAEILVTFFASFK